jgi:hypothetical protein
MSEPRTIKAATVAQVGGRGKSMADVDAQMQRIQQTIYDQYTARERFTLPDGRSGLREWTTDRGEELFRRAQRAYNAYSENIGRYLKPNAPEYEILWQTEENRRRRVPRSVYMRNNRR